MDWSKGFTGAYYCSLIEPSAWRAAERFEFTGGSIKREQTSLRQSADIDCRDFTYGEAWIRIYMDARQNGASALVPLFTGLSSCPEDDIYGYRIKHSVQLYSVLKPCDDVLLPRGWYAPAGAGGGQLVRTLLSVTPAPVVLEDGSPTLQSAIIAEDGETRLTMADKVLDAIGWRLVIAGDGTVTICPQGEQAVASFDPLGNDIVEKEIKRTYDWFECPNVFRAVSDGLVAEAKDESGGPLSIQGRGREIWQEETSCDLIAGESIGEYALRKLKELQEVGTTVSYKRRFLPGVNVGDIVTLSYPAQGITGNYRVTSQSIELGHGARTSEEVVKV